MIEYENLEKANKPFFDEYKNVFYQTLARGRFILGKNVEHFENEFADYCGSKYCSGVASGLDALIIALKSFDFESGSEVIVPSNTYIASILSIIHSGLKPILVEPKINTYNIDSHKIEEKINPKTKAIMIVHLYGKSCEMDKITEICKKHNLKLIEDCAQSHGATYKGQKTGSFGNYGCFSFYPTKNLGALGDGGAIITDNNDLIEQVKKLRNYGSNVKYVNDLIGYNSRLDEIQAGFLSVKLKKLDEINEHKRKLASFYLKNLKEDYIKPSIDKEYFDVFHIFNIRHKQRDKIKEYLNKNNVKTEIHYPIPPHKQKALKDFFHSESYPISEEIHQTTLSLPVSFYHTESDIYKVIELLNKY